MATHARQQYFADESSLSKEKREFSIAEEVQQKIDSIEEGAQVNTIETIKVNGTALVPDANKAVDIDVPEVIDNLYTVDSDNALSAKQGKLLYDYIQNIASRGRFLSNWNSATGLPMTNPSESPYPYKSGDYFVVSNVATSGGTNYRPDGSSYTIGQASTVVETDSVDVSDFYFYDGTNWLLLKNSGRSGAVDSSLSTTSTNPVENRVITNALNGKQETLIAGNNIQIAADGKTISATDTTYSAGANISIDANNKISATDTTYTAGANVQISAQNVISATDTKYTAGTGINIDANNVISNTQTSAEWGNITGTLSDQTDLQTALNAKQDDMVILKYGTSTWNDFITAYNKNGVVYCRASSNSDPSTGSQGRLAFMAYVNNASNPTEVEFQYYRSRSSHSTAANVLDEVYVYKLVPTGGGTWSVTQRDTAAKPLAGTGIGLTYNTSGMTISADTSVLATKTDLNSKQDTLVSGTNIKTINNNSLLGSGDIALNDVKVSATAPSSPTEGMTWYDTTNDVLKVYDGTNWNVTGKEYNAGEGIAIGTVHSDMQGPAPDGFHIPMQSEWEALCEILTSTFSMASNATTMGTYLKMPAAGFRYWNDAAVYRVGEYGEYWSSTPYSHIAFSLFFNSSNLDTDKDDTRAFGLSLRCFKDKPVIPISSWTTLYDGSSVATGAGVFYNATDGLISASGDGTTWYTIMDKNIGATTVYNQGDTLTDANCGNFYQWGNNYSFPHSGTVTTSSTKIDTSNYGPGNYYNSSTFITTTSNIHDWSSVRNDNLWGGVSQGTWIGDGNTIINTGVLSVNGQTGNVTVEEPIEYTAGNGISIGNLSISSRQGPCEEGFHVPSAADWQGVWNIMNAMNPLLVANGGPRKNYLHMPYAGGRDGNSLYGQGSTGAYWSSSKGTEYPSFSCMLLMSSNYFHLNDEDERSGGHSIRAFKNEYVAPDNTWTVVFGTLGNSGIFWNQTEGLITITNGTTGYTMMDKNIGATVVYNDGDTLSEANCGKYFQRGNNYGFPRTGNVTTSNTAVNTAGYGPSNPYSDDTFIVSHEDWSANDNGDLWGDITNSTTIINNVISNTGVLSVNGQTGNVTIEAFQLAPNSPLTPKYRRYGTQAQYEALTQYYTDEPGDTVYFTI